MGLVSDRRIYSVCTRAGTNTPSDEYDSYRVFRVANIREYSDSLIHSRMRE